MNGSMQSVSLVAIKIAAMVTILGAMPRISAQGVDKRPSDVPYDVVSVKRSTVRLPENIVDIRINPAGRIDATHISIRQVVLLAYELSESELLGGPKWLGSEHFDIVAVGRPDDVRLSDKERMRKVFKKVLAERFHFVAHTETVDLPAYRAVLDARGDKPLPGVVESRMTCGDVGESNGLPDVHGPPKCGVAVRPGLLRAGGVTIGQVLKVFSEQVGRLIVDETGLTSRYDVTLSWTPDFYRELLRRLPAGVNPPASGAGTPLIAPDGPSPIDALKQQLGIVLMASKAARSVLVIDAVERPTLN